MASQNSKSGRKFSEGEKPNYNSVTQQLPTRANIALYEAAKSGNLQGVLTSLDIGGLPNWFKNPDEGATAVHKACENGNVEIIEALLAAGGNINEHLLTTRNTPLHIACSFGHVGAVKTILEAGGVVNIGNSYGNSPLHSAVMSSNPAAEIVMLLLDKGADCNLQNHKLSSPLHFLAYSEFSDNNKLAVIEMLIKNGADVTLVNDTGMTALHGAARNASPDYILCLLNNGAVVNCVDAMGNTPYYYAKSRGNEQILKLLTVL